VEVNKSVVNSVLQNF